MAEIFEKMDKSVESSNSPYFFRHFGLFMIEISAQAEKSLARDFDPGQNLYRPKTSAPEKMRSLNVEKANTEKV